MKTNQVLIRKMRDFNVSQRTSDGMFNATELLKQWNKNRGQQKGVHHYFEQQTTKEFVNAILEEEFKERNSAKNSLSDIYTKSRGINGGTWMHPLLFIDFAMWLNPTFKVKVLRFVYDELIKYRNEAGDTYNEMVKSISRITEREFLPMAIQKVAQANNHIIYGRHERDIRNKEAEENLMQKLVEHQKNIKMLIDNDFIRSYEQLKYHLKRLWKKKNVPEIFS